jgi:hypothetical protein
VAGTALSIAATVVIASLCYRHIELPFWKGRLSSGAPVRVVQYAVAAVIVSVSLFASLERSVFGLQPQAAAAQGYDPRYDMSHELYGAGKYCDTGIYGTDVVPCPLGNKDGDLLAVLWGDSVGAQWSPAISGVLASPDWRVLVLTKSACAIIDKTHYYKKVGGPYEVCTEWRNKVVDYIAMVQPDLLVIGSWAFYDFTPAEWVDGTAGILRKVATSAEQMVLVPGTSALSFDAPSCLGDPWRFSFRLIDGERECEEAKIETITDDVAGYLQQAVDEFPNAVVLNLDDLVCPDRRCAAQTVDGVVVFRDDKHVTATFAKSIVPEVRRRMVDLGIRISAEKPEPDR